MILFEYQASLIPGLLHYQKDHWKSPALLQKNYLKDANLFRTIYICKFLFVSTELINININGLKIFKDKEKNKCLLFYRANIWDWLGIQVNG